MTHDVLIHADLLDTETFDGRSVEVTVRGEVKRVRAFQKGNSVVAIDALLGKCVRGRHFYSVSIRHDGVTETLEFGNYGKQLDRATLKFA